MRGLRFDDLISGALIATVGALSIVAGYQLVGGRSFVGLTNAINRLTRISTINKNRLLVLSLVLATISLIAAADFLRRADFQLDAGISQKRRVSVSNSGPQGFAAMGYHLWFAGTVPATLFYIWLWVLIRDRKAVQSLSLIHI